MNKETIVIDGVRYYADRPRSCRGCYFWKNRKVGCTLKKREKDKPILKQGTSTSMSTNAGSILSSFSIAIIPIRMIQRPAKGTIMKVKISTACSALRNK